MAPSVTVVDASTLTSTISPSPPGPSRSIRRAGSGIKGTRNQRQTPNSSNDTKPGYVDSSVESAEGLNSRPVPSSTRHYLPSSSYTKATATNPNGNNHRHTNSNGELVSHHGEFSPYPYPNPKDYNYNNHLNPVNNQYSPDLPDASTTSGPAIIVRGEEVGIVIVVLLLWVGAIILFFNRWGKIRMLEPYQPKFCENHRPSCPMVDATSLTNYPRTYSKFNLSTDMLGTGSPHFAKCNYHGIPATDPLPGMGSNLTVPGLPPLGLMRIPSRPRQNSVFVTSPNSGITLLGGSVFKNSSRKTKSAIDLSSLVLSEEFMENVRRNSKNSITHL